ncbi:DUF4381 domain-containing protein [Colwellia sp. D2M02]|uniref:DUF4381 domain-containing protein n=1 Tax=Colwellia sp. D2M02 TaxID=2841562 RepID=UPI001C094F98|nr:DUF4381 domain-containing protein [Colwellia sp. D2M02]MBU2893607.1 DUF4381 domain-containing protein [Colwellia sp. D2M02]
MMDNSDLENLELYQLMAEIKPVSEPAVISMWPQGPGWTVLLVCVAVIAVLALAIYKYKQFKQRHRRFAIAEINALNDNASPLAISSILKRCAFNDFNRAQIASLTGTNWVDFLNAHCHKHTPFHDFYQQDQQPELVLLKQQAIIWLSHYKVKL